MCIESCFFLELFGGGDLCIFIMVPGVLCNTQVLVAFLYICFSAFVQLLLFNPGQLNSFCNHLATIIESEWHPDILALNSGEVDHWVDISVIPGIQLVEAVFQIQVLMNVISTILDLYSAKPSSTHMWGIKS